MSFPFEFLEKNYVSSFLRHPVHEMKILGLFMRDTLLLKPSRYLHPIKSYEAEQNTETQYLSTNPMLLQFFKYFSTLPSSFPHHLKKWKFERSNTVRIKIQHQSIEYTLISVKNHLSRPRSNELATKMKKISRNRQKIFYKLSKPFHLFDY